jgi:hypothetical protein
MNMAKVSVTNDELRVSIRAFESIQALQRSFSIPLELVRGATEDSNYIKDGLGFRSPGTGFPGLIAKGTFRKVGEKTLCIWNKDQEIVVIELVNAKWNRLVLGCEDAKLIAMMINDAKSK